MAVLRLLDVALLRSRAPKKATTLRSSDIKKS